MGFFDALFGKNNAPADQINGDESETNAAEQLKEKLLKIAKTEIRIAYEKADAPLAVCSSKIGGRPAVPEDFVWPEYEGKGYLDDEAVSRPLSFMAQFNLKEIAAYDTENLLPQSGILIFFYEQVTMMWGFNPSDKGSARVFYFPEEEKLSLRDLPDDLDKDFVIPELAVSFAPHISIPDDESYPGDDLDCDWEEYDACRAECGYEYDEWGDVTKLLGYPDVIQNPMEEECERVTRGWQCGSPKEYAKISDAEKADIKEKSKDWMLLFQMGTITVEDAEFMFGDCGHIYFWIRRADLEVRNFENIWLILQCG